MIRALVRLAVANPVAANLAVLALLVAGVRFYWTTPREVFPDFSLGKIEVQVAFPGASPEDVERLLTDPIEEVLAEVPDIDEMTSSSQENLVRIELLLTRGADMQEVLREVREALDRGDLELPSEAEEPIVRERETVFPVINVQVYGEAPWPVLHQAAKDVRRALGEIPQVRNVLAFGVRDPEVWVEVREAALEDHNLTLEQVAQAVQSRLREVPLGSLQEGSDEWLVGLQGRLESASDLSDLPVASDPNGRMLKLGEIARLSDTFERPRTRARFNGNPSIHMQVNKVADGDIIQLAAAIRAWVYEHADQMPAGVRLGFNSDLSIYVKNRLLVMTNTGKWGALLVLASLMIFLNLRVALAVALGIPVAFLGGLLLAGAMGVTLNMITMFALIVVLGMVVDDAIVVGENIHRRIEEGEEPHVAAVEGTLEVGPAVLATVITSVAAFLPILMLQGQIGLFMRPMPLVVSFCLLASLIEALTVLPVHIAHWVKPHTGRAGRPARSWLLPYRDRYLAFMDTCMRWRYVTVGVATAGAILVAGVARYHLPFRFFDDFETTMFYVGIEMPPGTPLDETERVARQVETVALDLPASELMSVHTLLGVSAADPSNYSLGSNLAQVWVELNEGAGRTLTSLEVMDWMRQRLEPLTPAWERIEVLPPDTGPSGKAVELILKGPDLAVLDRLASDVRRDLGSYVGTRAIRDNLRPGKRELDLELSAYGHRLGLNRNGLSAELRTALEGRVVGSLRRRGDDVDVRLKLPEAVRQDRGALLGLGLSLPQGGRIPMGQVVDVRESRGPMEITHLDRERSVRIVADVDRSKGNAAEIVTGVLARHADLSQTQPGYSLVAKGESDESARSMASLLQASLISAAIIYWILGALFRSYSQPLVIMFLIPFGLVGVLLGHWLMDRSITVMSMVGALALSGIVVNDSLILVDFANVRRRAGASLREALLDAGRLRFRPILLTTLTTMLGLMHLALFAKGQAQFLQPMAISLFFGLAVATGLILIVVPCAYWILQDVLDLPGRWRSRRAGPEGGVQG
ncbi:MAG: efflux RND transporter permease subunit [Planctomycetes bacterium]|nr:efflux RND transporter permease subunit [Planctomycetota bacterium]MCB9913019.1 efflux RND transporter permease subunit [Planctomycetota bacterium]HPF12679.1 efflux RND transporter permease subunit [Planctomycetota bacterium]